MTSEIEQLIELFKITEAQAIMMIDAGFKIEDVQSSVEKYVNSKIENLADIHKNKITDIVNNELTSD